jgi:hypothetical protein
LSWDPDNKFVRCALERISSLLAKFWGDERREVVLKFIPAALISGLDDLAGSDCMQCRKAYSPEEKGLATAKGEH